MKRFIGILLTCTLISASFAQTVTTQLVGYVKDMQTLWLGKDDDILSDNLIHNRLNFSAFAGDFTFHAGMRNRLMWGDFTRMEDYREYIGTDGGYQDLSWNLIGQDGLLLNASIDRLYMDYTYNKFQITLGRQRINWGLNLVWNPNDLFNAYSFLDFDYEERPGSDALRIQYYTGMASSIEVVAQASDSLNVGTLAALWRFNIMNYDVQLLGGKTKDDWIAGGGWAGDIVGAGFRGEGTWFYSPDSISERAHQFVASISADYTFDNSLYFHLGGLYNSKGAKGNAGVGSYFQNADLSAKNLSFARYSLFAQLTYPISPIISATFSGIMNPMDYSLFVGPSMAISLSDNLALSLMGQVFVGEEGTEFGGYGQLYYLRLKYSF